MSRSLFFQVCFCIAIFLSLLNTGCSTLSYGTQKAGSWVGLSQDPDAPPPPPTQFNGDPIVKFSENPNTYNPSNRQYRKMTRTRMEEEAQLHDKAGSMWVNEGQGAYLFAQNKSRREGDLLNVKIEGSAQKQVETKVSVIKKLLKQLEEEELKKNQPEVPAGNLAQSPKGETPARAPASEPKKVEEKDEPLNLEMVPTRIVERLPDGNYRVKGQQPFMIGKREYKVIVTGLVRPEDFNDQSALSSNQLLDPQFDVVSIRRN